MAEPFLKWGGGVKAVTSFFPIRCITCSLVHNQDFAEGSLKPKLYVFFLFTKVLKFDAVKIGACVTDGNLGAEAQVAGGHED